MAHLVIGILLFTGSPIRAENVTTIDLSTQPNLKSWSNIIPNASRRFVVLLDFTNAAVLDRETGLVWEKSPAIAGVDWSTASYECLNKNVGGRKGWRLPSAFELATLIEPSVAAPGPTLAPGHPFANIQAVLYWSATTGGGAQTDALGVSFFFGNINFASRTGNNPFWCVRSSMNTD